MLPTYRLIAAGLVDAFQSCGTPAAFGAARSPGPMSAVDCFESAARCDIVDGHTGRKLAGCAQRREGAALLQQMSLPLANIPDQSEFLASLRCCLAAHLAVSCWQADVPLSPS